MLNISDCLKFHPTDLFGKDQTFTCISSTRLRDSGKYLIYYYVLQKYQKDTPRMKMLKILSVTYHRSNCQEDCFRCPLWEASVLQIFKLKSLFLGLILIFICPLIFHSYLLFPKLIEFKRDSMCTLKTQIFSFFSFINHLNLASLTL